jgi:hypothetical protein
MKIIVGKNTMKAKTIVENKFWIVEEEDGVKVGTISCTNGTVTVNINNRSEIFSTLEEVTSIHDINFTKKTKPSKSDVRYEVYDYPTAHTPHNALWFVERKLPIYTKTSKSNSYHCAGYYIIKFEHGWVKSFSPKLITLQRYPYQGPYKTKLEMMEQLRLKNDGI